MATFNPYHKWLGISLKEQPPNHYRLLGIDVFESDPEVIEAAADRQMAYIHQCASGVHVEESQKLLNELSQARVCLLNQEKKRKYDTTLRSQSPTGSTSAISLQETANKSSPITQRADSRKRRRRRSSWSSPKIFGLIGIAVVLSVVVGVIVSRDPGNDNSEPVEKLAQKRNVTNRVRIEVRISQMQEFRVYRDRVVWTSREGVTPQSVKVNQIDWKPAANLELANEAGTQFMVRDVSLKSAVMRPVRARGKVTFHKLDDHVYVNISDPQPGADLYIFEFQFKEVTAGKYALRFDKRAHVEIAESRDLLNLNGAFTVEMWVRAEENVDLASDELWPMMNPQAPSVTTPAGWLLRNGADGGVAFRIGVADGSRLHLKTGQVLDRTRWQHVAVSKSPDQISLYVDGRLVGQTDVLGRKFAASSSSLYLGVCKHAFPHRRFNGDIRAVRISSIARYSGKKFDPPAKFQVDKQTVSLLDFSAGAGVNVPDLSGNNHYGSLRGVRWVPENEVDAKTIRLESASKESPLARQTVEEFADLYITGRFDDLTIHIDKDKAVCQRPGTRWPWPLNLKLNGVAWAPSLKNTMLSHSGPTRFLANNVSFNDVLLTKHSGRGKVVLTKGRSNISIQIVDPQPGGAVYSFSLLFKLKR